MSVAVGTFSVAKTTVVLSSKMKEEEQKIAKAENFCELEKNTVVSKDLIEDLGKKTGDQVEDDTKKKGDEDACLKSDSQISIGSNDEKAKGNECLSKHKQQILGSVDTHSSAVGENKGPEVQILSLTVLSPGRADNVLSIPFPSTTSKATLFTLKEGSKYRIKFHLTVSKKTVNGLTYTYMVWKAGIRVHQTKKLIGTFNPRQEPYIFELEEGTTPTGFFARGPFLVRSKFVDDDGNCYLDTTYYFDIRKDWGARDKC